MRAETYIVRIYRRGRGEGEQMVGVVETAGARWQEPFRSAEELASILAARRSRARAKPAPGAGLERTKVKQR